MHTKMRYRIEDCSGVILAGGENRRMPVPKAFLKINGERIIGRNVRIMRELFQETFVVTNEPEKYLYLGTPLIGDIYNVRGPMSGIFTALVNSSKKWVFVSACDMPFINKNLIVYMASRRYSCEAVVPRSALAFESRPDKESSTGNTRPEPLFAFYSKRLIPDMEKAVVNGPAGLKDFLLHKRVKYISPGEIKKIDEGSRSFINLNTPDDVKNYLRTDLI